MIAVEAHAPPATLATVDRPDRSAHHQDHFDGATLARELGEARGRAGDVHVSRSLAHRLSRPGHAPESKTTAKRNRAAYHALERRGPRPCPRREQALPGQRARNASDAGAGEGRGAGSSAGTQPGKTTVNVLPFPGTLSTET